MEKTLVAVLSDYLYENMYKLKDIFSRASVQRDMNGFVAAEEFVSLLESELQHNVKDDEIISFAKYLFIFL